MKELRKESKREGMEGISPRYVQDKISNALVNETGEGTINPFMVLNELDKGLRHHSLITNDEQRKRFQEIIGLVKREYEEIVKNEVQRAISADEDAIAKLAGNYIDNIKAFTLKERVKNRYTGQDEDADERLMRSIEEKIDIAENRKDDFRREIMNFIGALAVDGKKFQWSTNDRLRRALELKLFEDQKDSIKLKTLVSAVVDKETQEKIDIIKSRLMKSFGYNEVSATDVLNYVASIFARGLTSGSSGNISLRLSDGGFLVTPTGSSLGTLDPARLTLLDAAGRYVSGDRPTKELPLHAAIYETRGELSGAVVHLHSTHSVGVSILPGVDPDCVFPPLTAYSVMRLGRVAMLPYFRPGDPAMAEAVREHAGTRSAFLLAHHGPVVAGKTLDDAVNAMEEFEETARLMLLTFGKSPNTLSKEQVADLVTHFDVQY